MSEEYVRLQNVNKINFYDGDSATIYMEGVSTGGVSGVSMATNLMVSGEYMNFGNTMGTTGYGLHNDSGTIQFKHSGGDWASITGASVSGSDTQIQFNDNGSFGASSGFTFNNSNNELNLINGNIKLDNGGGFITVEINNNDSANGNDSSIRLGSANSSSNNKNIEIIGDNSTGTGGPKIKLKNENSPMIFTVAEISASSTSDDGYLYGGKLVLGSTDIIGNPSQTDIFRIDAPNQRIVMLDRDSGLSVKFGVSSSITQNSNFFLPNGNGADGYVLSTDGSGNTSWVTQSGGGGGTPSDPENSIQFNSSSAFTGTSSLQFFEASSNTGGVSALTVAGNVFSSMGVSDVTSQEPTSTYYQLTTSEYVNGVVFLPYQATGEEQFYEVRVPSATSVSTDFGDVLKEGQFFDTILYGTSLGVSQTVLSIGDTDNSTTTYYPADITVLSSSDNTTIFDTRLIRDRSGFTGQGLSFHFSELGLEYYQGVVIRSRYNSSAGISMYPISNSFYTF